jgi:hypothetical protein
VKRQCVFCHADKVSKEHVIPSWVAQAIPWRGGGLPLRHTTSRGTWETNALSFTVKRVCRECNHGWMETDIEAPARPILTPMIQGRPSSLTPEEQQRVATWAVKTHMMAQYRHIPLRPVVEEQLRWLFEKRTPPPKSRVWITGYVGHLMHGAWGRTFNFQMSPGKVTEIAPADIVDAEMMTLCIGHLVLQSFKWAGAVEQFSLNFAGDINRFFTPIWPRSSIVLTWPPTWTLDNEESLANFADAFVNTGEPPA